MVTEFLCKRKMSVLSITVGYSQVIIRILSGYYNSHHIPEKQIPRLARRGIIKNIYENL